MDLSRLRSRHATDTDLYAILYTSTTAYEKLACTDRRLFRRVERIVREPRIGKPIHPTMVHHSPRLGSLRIVDRVETRMLSIDAEL